ncbi:MAG: HEAT repeat domain-containing protein [Asgard group archaeon]|nr:HEAT repeat domain-containing protein [Asgard group archaeon]
MWNSMIENKINRLIEQLYMEDNKEMRMKAVRELGRLPVAPLNALPHLYVKLSDENHMIRKACIVTLGRIALKAPEKKAIIIDKLNYMLQETDQWTQYWAAHWLTKLGVRTSDVLTIILKCLVNSSDMILRKTAAELLGELKELSEKVIPALENVRKNDEMEAVRNAANNSLMKLRE